MPNDTKLHDSTLDLLSQATPSDVSLLAAIANTLYHEQNSAPRFRTITVSSGDKITLSKLWDEGRLTTYVIVGVWSSQEPHDVVRETLMAIPGRDPASKGEIKELLAVLGKWARQVRGHGKMALFVF